MSEVFFLKTTHIQSHRWQALTGTEKLLWLDFPCNFLAEPTSFHMKWPFHVPWGHGKPADDAGQRKPAAGRLRKGPRRGLAWQDAVDRWTNWDRLPTYVAGPSRAAGSRPRGCQGAPDCQDLIHLFISCLFVSSLSSVDICVIDSVGSKQYDNELETSGKHFCELKILKCIGQDRMQSPWEPARTRKIQSHQLNPICCWDPKNPESVFFFRFEIFQQWKQQKVSQSYKFGLVGLLTYK